MFKIKRETILVYFLSFVVFYFGVNEIFSPEDWVSLVPSFFGSGITYLIIFHGVFLILLGFALILNFYRRIVAFILSLMLLSIIIVLISKGGLNEIVVRDIGLFGIALALSFKS